MMNKYTNFDGTVTIVNMEPTYRKALLRDKSDFERIVSTDSKNIKKTFLSGNRSANVNFIISKAVSSNPVDQLFTIEFDSNIIGFIQFYGFNNSDSSILIGYILDQNYQGKGLLHKICNELFIKYFESGIVNNIYTIIQKKNKSSIKFIEKLNFKFEKRIFTLNLFNRIFGKELNLYYLSKSNFLNLKT